MNSEFLHPPAIELPEVSFFGRSFAEYLAFFGLSRRHLFDRRILDVAGGPSSFACEAADLGIEVTAVDPLYARTESALRQQHAGDFARMFAQMRARPGMFDTTTFASIDAAEADRRQAARRFLDDYYTGVAVGRYVAGALPALPFDAEVFDLTLCGHLLFTYDELFDAEFHHAAINELLRVTRSDGEIRIHPLVNRHSRRSRYVDEVLSRLRGAGHETSIRPVDYSFFRGATEMLVISRNRAAPSDRFCTQ